MRKLNLQEMALVSAGNCEKDENSIMAATSVCILASLGIGNAIGAIFGETKLGGILGVVATSTLLLWRAAKDDIKA